METIKTNYKSKIPKDFSYPVGAEILSKAFADLKQYDNLELSFSDREELWTSEFNKILKNQGDILVLRLEYKNVRPGFSASKSLDSWYGKHWSITVYAVPQQIKNIVKIALIEKYLLRGKNWLNEQYHQKIDNSNYLKFEIFFNLEHHHFNVIEKDKR